MRKDDGLTVGDRIKQRRIELGLLQEEVAERAGYVGKSAISKIEHGGNTITMKQVRRMASALDCSMEYLMGWSEPTNIKVQDKAISSNDIPLALDLYAQYQNAPREVQVAIDVLLKSSRSDL